MAIPSKDGINSALLRDFGWNGYEKGLTLNLTYSFADQLPYWTSSDFGFTGVLQGSIRGITREQQDVFLEAVMRWENVADIHLNAATPETGYKVTTDGMDRFFGDIVVAGGKFEDPTTLAVTTSPSQSRAANSVGDIVIGNTG